MKLCSGSTEVKDSTTFSQSITSNACHLIVFVKAPVPGQVKTRLVSSVGASGAARLYEGLALQCIATAVNSRVGVVELWCTPSTDHPFFRRCAEDFKVNLRLQTDGDIGRRMAHAFHETLKGPACALLMGTDCSSLTQEDLREAQTAMDQGADAVLGPTEDGGYSLLGLRRYAHELFTGISWGTEAVLEQTRARLRDLRWRWHELPKRWDVDRPEDVERLIREGYLELNEHLRKTVREISR